MANLKKRIHFKTIIVLLGAVLIVSSLFSLFTIQRLEGNARVINYAGIVRGATQRLVKQELNNVPNDALIEKLSAILNNLENGGHENNLVRVDDEVFQVLVGQMQTEWSEVKNGIYAYREGGPAENLYEISEDYFELADQTVSVAEEYTEYTVQNAKYFLLLVTLIFLMLVIAYGYFASAQQKREEKLLADEKAAL